LGYAHEKPMEDKLILFQKIYDLILWLFPLINRIPKYHKTVLGRQIEELGLSMLLLTLSANRARGTKRKKLQLALSDELDKLRILLRLTKDLRFMSIKQYSYSARLTNEIGKILYG
jgi:hypothetical protein